MVTVDPEVFLYDPRHGIDGASFLRHLPTDQTGKCPPSTSSKKKKCVFPPHYQSEITHSLKKSGQVYGRIKQNNILYA